MTTPDQAWASMHALFDDLDATLVRASRGSVHHATLARGTLQKLRNVLVAEIAAQEAIVDDLRARLRAAETRHDG